MKKFAIIGCGHIGQRHAHMIRSTAGAELVGLVDVRTELKENLETEFKVPFFESEEALYASGIEIDVVNICTPNGLHAQQSLNALQRKCHVVCEKPMGLTKAECEEVLFQSLQSQRLVFCVMQNRYSPPSAWLKELIQSGKLGKIYMVQINCYWNRDERYYTGKTWKGKQELDGGTLFTQFSHFIDIMFWLFGDITDIQARFNDFNHADLTDFEDSGFVNFSFLKGGMGSINYSTAVWNANMESSLTIVAEHGSVKVGGQYMDKVEYCHVKDYSMPELPPSSPPNDYGHYKGSAANHHFVIQNVLDTLEGRTMATTNALEGLKVVDIIERIYACKPL
jgi:UDP-N-acetyl-2-amino-2-deoxyglucuronate dehydrogenase